MEPILSQIHNKQTKEIKLTFFPGEDYAYFDWLDEWGDLSRDHIWLIERNDEAGELLPHHARVSISGGLPEDNKWTVFSWEILELKTDRKSQTWKPIDDERAREASLAFFAMILDLIFGDFVELYYPEQCIYCSGPGGTGLGVVTVYFRPKPYPVKGPSEKHWRNWMVVMGTNSLSGGSVDSRVGKKRKRPPVESDSDLEIEPREKIAREVIDELEGMGSEQKKFVREVNQSGKDVVSVFSLAVMPEGFAQSCPSLGVSGVVGTAE